MDCRGVGRSLSSPTFAAMAGRAAAEVGSFVSTATGRALPFDRGRYRELTNDTMFDASRLLRDIGFTYPLGAEPMFRALARAYRSEVAR